MRLSPLGARALLGMPAGALAGVDVHGTEVLGDLAERVGWSERHLTGRFRAEYGLTPKTALRLARFDRARRRIGAAARSGPHASTSLAQIAAVGGYADQSHLAREFRDFAGVAPSRWVAQEFGNVQAGECPPGAGSIP